MLIGPLKGAYGNVRNSGYGQAADSIETCIQVCDERNYMKDQNQPAIATYNPDRPENKRCDCGTDNRGYADPDTTNILANTPGSHAFIEVK